MADIVTISADETWSAGAWIARFVIRAIHEFLPKCDAAHIADRFEKYEAGSAVNLSQFSNADLLIIYHAARHAHNHLTAFRLNSAFFQDDEFSPDEGFVDRFSKKLSDLIDVIAKDDRVSGYVSQT